jgi:hypothetical protein
MTSFSCDSEVKLKIDIEEDFNKNMAAHVEEQRWSPERNFYDWKEVYPDELQKIHDNIDVIIGEAMTMSTKPWIPWPEESLNGGNPTDWTVFPFLHTFPALDESRSRWISSTCNSCPKTYELLKSIPNIRTALFSRMSGNTTLSTHTGWCDLANYVLRIHICLHIPNAADTMDSTACGLCVDDEIRHHVQGEIIVFGDSKKHKAFNHSEKERIVLILDILRPVDVPLGTCVGGHTSQLNGLINKFG